jgi:phosphomannomutase
MEEGQRFVELYRSGERRQAKWNEVGWLEDRTDIQQRHIDRVLQQVDVETIRRRQFRVLVDANHGAGGPLMVNLLERLGCGVHGVGLNPDGLFAHEPEPTEENLRGVAPSVAKEGCALGLALDPDSDRLALIDEKGHYIGEELTLALALRYRLAQQRGPVVVNMSTSRLAEDLAQRFGCAFARSAVGEANVVQRMMGLKAVLGGEGNGGVIDPRVGWVRDPYIGTAMVLALLAETGRSLSNLVAELPTYSIVKDKFKVDGTRLPLVYEALRKQWSNVPTNTEDGLRLDWQDRWVHIRPSNTEPVVRIIAEAPSASLAQALIRETANVMSSVL